MQRTGVWVAVVVMMLSAAMYAGTIRGRVSGVYGTSVVWVDAVPGKTFSAPAKHAEMDQKGLKFQPHILVVEAGSTVDFLNSDVVAHNIFWPSISGNRKLHHNLGTWPTGDERSFKFERPGVVPLLCNVHPEMSGYIVVSPTPYFAESGTSGAFTIANVPDGKYTVTAWHEGAKTVSKPVSVSGDATVDFRLSN
jgi:plastocyanin